MNQRIASLILGLAGLLLLCSPVTAHNVRAGFGVYRRGGGAQSRRAIGSTSNAQRNLVGNVPYGQIITQCKQSKVVALTFDDGPSIYTESVLSLLKKYNAKATFFITTNNGMGPIDSEPWVSLVRRMMAEGHQVAHHSWTHRDMSTLDANTRRDEIVRGEEAFVETLGLFPTYLRPPYGSCNADCLAQARRLGYHVINWDVDSDDWRYQTEIERSEKQVESQLTSSGGHIVLAHDIHYNSSTRLTQYMLELVKKKGLKPVTVGECLGDPSEFWYRRVSQSTATTTAVPVLSNPGKSGPSVLSNMKESTDGRCGAGVTCASTHWGFCCSRYGWCGSSADHCNSGCQPQFGRCT